MIRCLPVLLASFLVAGCQTDRWGPYISPRVTGQVVAADTDQPVAGVSVSRGHPEHTAGWPPKGGELMIRKLPARTDQKGEFVLESERVLSVFRGSGWNQVRLRFEKPGYVTLQTNFPVSLETNLAAGEPVLAIGKILLDPVVK